MTEAENEMERLDKEAEEILENDGPESPLLMDLYEVCDVPFLYNIYPQPHLFLAAPTMIDWNYFYDQI